MLSVMGSKGFDSDLRVSSAPISGAGNGNEAVSSISSDGEEARASEDVDCGRGIDLNGVSLVSEANSIESEHKFSVVENEDRKLNFGSEVVSNSEVDAGDDEFDERADGAERSSSVVSEYDLMLSKFDDFAANGKCWAVGWGYEMGDMVWGKVKSHPWWPGHIFNEAFATTSVKRSKRDGHILVAFFGDSSYGWFEPSELVPFEPNFREKSQQTNLRSFTKAVEEAVDELSRRCALGLVCRCRQADNFRPVPGEGFFEVDLNENEKNFIYTASQIQKSRESFRPRETLAFTKKLALTPLGGDFGSINFMKNIATAIAYRKAVFAPNDPTYAEAFGSHMPKHLQQMQAKEPAKEPQRASLSGRIVSMEVMGKGKLSMRHSKAVGQSEKDRYLLKRRDEPENQKNRKGGTLPIVADDMKSTSGATSIEELEHPQNQDSAVGESHATGQAQDSVAEKHNSVPNERKHQSEGFIPHPQGGKAKVKNRKRLASEASSETEQSLGKKKKKKKNLSAEMGSDSAEKQVACEASSENSQLLGKKKKKKTILGSNSVEKQVPGDVNRVSDKKSHGDSVPVPSGPGEDKEIDNQRKGDAASTSLPEQAVSQQHELPQLLSDLHTLALNPFHGLERRNPATTRNVFLRFRSLVFQKSLASLLAENEATQAPSAKLRETAPAKLPKRPSIRPDDPTKGGRKRGPSDRQEEISAKKKKKMSDLKLLAAERKNSQRPSEVPKIEGKEPVTKVPTKVPRPDTGKGMEQQPAKVVPEPTMLIMKFPPNGALPSIPELKARFARFGPLDHSATRVFWKSSTCRLVYRYKHHAEAALKFADSCSNLFGNTDVTCFLREVEAAETTNATKVVSKEENSAMGGGSQPKDVAADRPPARVPPQQPQPPVQLKSCLKRPPGEEAGNGSGSGGNGSSRGSRVKFDLGGEDNSKAEVAIDSKNTKTTTIAASSSDSSNVKNFSKVIFPTTAASTATSTAELHSISTSAQFQTPPTNLHLPEAMAQRNLHNFNTPSVPFATANIDISQQMISLLSKCHDVVFNLTNVLGYTPYHTL